MLWLSAALGAIAFSLANTVRGETERTSTSLDSLRSYYLAEAAIQQQAIHMVWSLSGLAPRERYYLPGVSLVQLNYPTGVASVEIIPEAAKLDINHAPPEELFRVLIALGVEPERARGITMGIVEWRTPAPPGVLPVNPSFRPRHASFEEIEELLLIPGMTPELFYGTYERNAQANPPRLVPRGGFADCVSVFGTVGPVDINTAAPAVLAAIGVPPEIIGVIVQRRRQAPLVRPDQVQPLLGAAGPAAGRLRIGGNSIFTLRATARLRLDNGQFSDLRRTVAAQMKFMQPGYDPPVHTLRWYDSAWSH